jgi:hypothetical protein
MTANHGSACGTRSGCCGSCAGNATDTHPDDEAVDRFAAAMKEKLAAAREKGSGGWEDKSDVSAEELTAMLLAHVWKGDPRDVANFCMFLHQRGEAITFSDDGSRLSRAVEAFQLAEQECAERHAADGNLIEPGIAVEAGLLAALRLLGEHDGQAEVALRKVAGVIQRHMVPDGISKHDAMTEIIAIVDVVPMLCNRPEAESRPQ